MSLYISPADLHAALQDGDELALIDVREQGVFYHSHLFWAVCIPLSRLELLILDLVPRKSVRIVLCDDGPSGIAGAAMEVLGALGYGDVRILEGGTAAWAEAGYELYSGVNVPSKAFGEFVEHAYDTPRVPAQELDDIVRSGRDMVILDSRPVEEYRRMNIPGGIDVPGAELVYRVHEIAPDPGTLVVVNCAGRTRSIIGAQSLINAGIPNEVAALKDGTMGWELAGFSCEHGAERFGPDPSPDAVAVAQDRAAAVARRFGVRFADKAAVEGWQAESRHPRPAAGSPPPGTGPPARQDRAGVLSSGRDRPASPRNRARWRGCPPPPPRPPGAVLSGALPRLSSSRVASLAQASRPVMPSYTSLMPMPNSRT